jgi:hypothetical protein
MVSFIGCANARQLLQHGKEDEGCPNYREIAKKYYASPGYRNVKCWMDERK